MRIQRPGLQQTLQRVAQKLATGIVNVRFQLADAVTGKGSAIYRVFFCAASSIKSARKMLGRS